MSSLGRDSQTGLTPVPGPETCWPRDMLAPCQCFKQDLCFVHLQVCLCLCCFFLLSLYADETLFLKTKVATARDWGEPRVSFDPYIHPLSAMVGATGICLTLHRTYQLLDAWPKPGPSLLGPLAKPRGLALPRGSSHPAVAPSKQESWEH